MVKKQISKKEYEHVNIILMKVKRQFLAHKASLYPDKPLEAITLTDQDLIPLDLFNKSVSEMKQKQEIKRSLFQELV